MNDIILNSNTRNWLEALRKKKGPCASGKRSCAECNCNCNLFAVHKPNLGYIPVDVDIVINISCNIVFTES